MKRIVGFQNKGGMILKMDYIYDKDIVAAIGKKGHRKLIRRLLLDVTYLKFERLVYYPAEDVLAEIEEIIDNAILENRYRV